MTEEVKILYSLQAEHKGLKLWLVSREIATEVRISTLIIYSVGGKVLLEYWASIFAASPL